MPLTSEDLEQVLDYLKSHPESWMPAHVLDLAGRISTLEAELKAGRDVMIERFDAMDKRFESLQKQLDERFGAMQKQMDERFAAMQKQMDERFTAMDRRFESIDRRFDEQSRHMNRWMTAMTIVLALVGVAMTVTNVIG
ncbi:MAG: hypothetical protein ACLFPO_11935 [Spirochaetaceae bacterium]